MLFILIISLLAVIVGFYLLICLSGVVYIVNGVKAYRSKQALVSYRDIRFSWSELWHFPAWHVNINNNQAVQWGIGQIISGLLSFIPLIIGILLLPMFNVPLINSIISLNIAIFFPFLGLGLHYALSQIYGRRGEIIRLDFTAQVEDYYAEKLKNLDHNDDNMHSGIDPFYEPKRLTK